MAKWPRFDPDADRRLAKALSEGGEGSLAALYDIYAERLRDYCGSLIRDRRLATDIVHDTLIDAHRRVRRMRDRTRLRAWLYAAVRRRCLQRVRRPALRWERGGAAANDDEARALLETAFERLDFLDQESLLLSLRHDMTGDDLGALLGIPVRRAGARVARAQVRAEEALDRTRRSLARRCAADELPRSPAPVDGEIPYEPAEDEPDSHHAEPEPAGSAETTGLTTGPTTGGTTDLTTDVAWAEGSERSNGSNGSAEHAEGGSESAVVSSVVASAAVPSAATRSAITSSTAVASTAASPPFEDAELADHMAGCADCRRRADLSLAALLDLVPAPPLPSSLRHRVIHTGTDPELAGYRTDIVARGGTLNADGLPRQPDIPSQFARRWLFTTGGMVGAAVTALVAAFLIGPGAPGSGLIWPSYRPEPSISPVHPARPPAGRQPPPPARGPGLPNDAVAHGNGQGNGRSPTPTPVGVLAVAPDTIDFGTRGTVAKLTLAAAQGPLSWRAGTSTSRIALSADSGRIAAGDAVVIKVRFSRGLIELPGKETITVVDSAGRAHPVTVVWNISLL